MPAIVVAGQSPGTNGNAFIGRIGCAVKMVGREPERLLCGFVAFNLDVAVMPTLVPGRLVALDNPMPAEPLRVLECVLSDRAGIAAEAVTAHEDNHPFEICGLAGHGFPPPPPFEFVDHQRRQILAVELQCHSGCHCEALSRFPNAPDTEIPCKERRFERGIRHHTGYFHRDLSLSANLDAEDLQSGSAIDQRNQTERAYPDNCAAGLRRMPRAKERAPLHVERPSMRRHVTRASEQWLAIHE